MIPAGGSGPGRSSGPGCTRGKDDHGYSNHSGPLNSGETVTGGRCGGAAVMVMPMSAVVLWCFEDLLLP